MLTPLFSLFIAVSTLPAQNVPDTELVSWVAEAIIQDARDVTASPGEFLLERGRRPDLDIATDATGRLTNAGVYGMVVACSDGAVILRGEVRDEALRAKAETLAAGVPGARSVKNLLRLAGEEAAAPAPVPVTKRAAPGPAQTPAQTEAFDFLTTDHYAGQGVVVAADKGVVTLTGRVNSHAARTYAALVAQRVPKVRTVRNQLDVRAGDAALDRQMQRELQVVLDFATMVQAFANDLTVSVKDGIITLDGRVVHESQEREALRLAWRTPGAFLVLNNIELDGKL
ncbi:MAG: BON domain-containing protein, partial [Planctomycetota bacterium]